jgi:hypothetical protein
MENVLISAKNNFKGLKNNSKIILQKQRRDPLFFISPFVISLLTVILFSEIDAII